MRKTIEIYVMRHGEKQDDGLTNRGIAQVKASAKQHLTGICLSAIYSSPKRRAWQTAVAVMQASSIAYTTSFPTSDRSFWYTWLEENDGCQAAMADFKEVTARLGPQATVAQWLEAWPPAQQMRQIFICRMLEIAKTLPDGANVLVGCHQILAELAVCNPDEVVVLGYADIVRYTVEVTDEGVGRLIASEILRAPTVE